MERYYLVLDGDVTEVDPCQENYYEELENLGATENNTNEWIIAYATDEEEALKIADMSDSEELQMDNIWCQDCNKAHVAAKL